MESKGDTPTPVVQKQRELTDYNKFVKENYDSVRHLPLHDRFRSISDMWKAKKAEAAQALTKKKTTKKTKKKKAKKKKAEDKKEEETTTTTK